MTHTYFNPKSGKRLPITTACYIATINIQNFPELRYARNALIVHKTPTDGDYPPCTRLWTVTHKVLGIRIAYGPTRNCAIANARDQLIRDRDNFTPALRKHTLMQIDLGLIAPLVNVTVQQGCIDKKWYINHATSGQAAFSTKYNGYSTQTEAIAYAEDNGCIYIAD